TASTSAAWQYRHGWEGRNPPPVLKAGTTSIRKIEFADTRDLKQWMWKGTEGIAETTWPGVYNRSRLPGRDHYVPVPDSNTFGAGGKNFHLALPAGPVTRIEIRGAAFGELQYRPQAQRSFKALAKRPQGPVRSVYDIQPVNGGQLRFSNR